MTTPKTPSNWAAERGQKWLQYLPGMEATLKPVDKPLIDALRLDAPYRIADIACGGGGTTIDVLQRAPIGSVVCGFDISPPLIEVARGRQGSSGGVSFELADMQAARAPELYDRLISRFGIMFFNDPPTAFANIATWLKPGGRFAFAVWNDLNANPWLDFVRNVVSEVVQLAAAGPDEPGPFRYHDVNPLLALLKRAGFGEIETHLWRGALTIGGGLPPSKAAEFALASFSSFGEQLAQAGDGAYDEALALLKTQYAQSAQDNVIRMPASVHIVTGVRPVPAPS